jgi:hypothetical protein
MCEVLASASVEDVARRRRTPVRGRGSVRHCCEGRRRGVGVCTARISRIRSRKVRVSGVGAERVTLLRCSCLRVCPGLCSIRRCVQYNSSADIDMESREESRRLNVLKLTARFLFRSCIQLPTSSTEGIGERMLVRSGRGGDEVNLLQSGRVCKAWRQA